MPGAAAGHGTAGGGAAPQHRQQEEDEEEEEEEEGGGRGAVPAGHGGLGAAARAAPVRRAARLTQPLSAGACPGATAEGGKAVRVERRRKKEKKKK